jgi:hypothetical protein
VIVESRFSRRYRSIVAVIRRLCARLAQARTLIEPRQRDVLVLGTMIHHEDNCADSVGLLVLNFSKLSPVAGGPAAAWVAERT